MGLEVVSMEGKDVSGRFMGGTCLLLSRHLQHSSVIGWLIGMVVGVIMALLRLSLF